MWIATNNGLNRYDGASVQVYEARPKEDGSLRYGEVRDLAEDAQGNLWVAAEGLYRYERTHDRFARYPTDSLGRLGPMSAPQLIEYDDRGWLWLATRAGLERFDLRTGVFDQIPIEGFQGSIRHFFLAVDLSGGVWIADVTRDVVVRYDPRDSTSTTYRTLGGTVQGRANSVYAIRPHDGTSVWVMTQDAAPFLFRWIDQKITKVTFMVEPRMTRTMARDSSGRIWFAAVQNGLHLLELPSGRSSVYRPRTSDPWSIGSEHVNDVYVDQTGNVWIGTYAGVSRISRWRKPFTLYRNITDDASSLSRGRVTALDEDRDGRLWIAVMGVGMNRFDEERGWFVKYLGPQQFPSPYVRYVFKDTAGRLVASAPQARRYDPTADRFLPASDIPKLRDYPPAAFAVDAEGNRWFGFPFGVVQLRPDGSRKDWDETGPQTGLFGTNSYAMYVDSRRVLWVGAHSLHTWNPDQRRFMWANATNDGVSVILEDSEGGFWLGLGGGLAKYDRERRTIAQFFDRSNGLGGTSVSGLVEDERKSIWISTDRGISRLHLRTGHIDVFNNEDQIPFPSATRDFAYGNDAHVRRRDGRIAIGLGTHGFVQFHPDSILKNPDPPVMVLTGCWLNSIPQRSRLSHAQHRSLWKEPTLELDHDVGMFSISYAALDYTNPTANEYAYRLEGFDDDWARVGNRAYASYTNVPPGRYLFRVKGANRDGVWNEEGASIAIVIVPPWWQTSWAYVGYAGLLIGALLLIRRFELNRQRLKHQAELEHVEAEKLKELDRTKSQFFANISHEFRTPLTLIEGPMSDLSRGRFSGDRREVYEMVLRNARRLLRLVNQLLDLSRLDAGQRRLRPQKGDVVEAIRTIAASFESLASRRSIVFEVNAPTVPVRGTFDHEVLEQVLTNLLSNAFKFTPDGGMIIIDIPQSTIRNPKSLQFSVSDTGVGIPQDALDKVFDRFYQVDASQTREQEGSGIGLALTKELVELHGGSIAVASREGGGSTFSVTLPIDLPVQTGEHELPSTVLAKIQAPLSVEPDTPVDEEDSSPTEDGSLPVLLVIDDNRDMRRYIRRQLEEQYRVIEASNGKEGLEVARSKSPDLVVSDVMMPKMDGFEVCRRLKHDMSTSHIPVILLTAKAGDGHKLEGLETGADDYLVKPFDARELRVRLKNLYAQRQRMQEAYRRELVVQPTGVKVESMDEQFLKKVFETIEGRMSDPNLSPEVIARSAAVSRMTLHRKLKAITGMSVGELIRDLRLQRAQSLLQQNAGTVSEVAYQVGFNNLSHFARQFRAKFGSNPSAIR